MGEQGKDFSWQEGYGAFSVSSSNLDQVVRYIQNQEVHHRKTSFEEEFRALLRKHGVEYDPKFVLGQACAAPPGLRFIPRMFTHRFRGGLRSFVPNRTLQRIARVWVELSGAANFNCCGFGFLLVGIMSPLRGLAFQRNTVPRLPLPFVHGNPFTSHKASAVGYVVSSLTGLFGEKCMKE
jgi:hypothetical protein